MLAFSNLKIKFHVFIEILANFPLDLRSKSEEISGNFRKFFQRNFNVDEQTSNFEISNSSVVNPRRRKDVEIDEKFDTGP